MSTNIVAITLREAPWQNLADDIVIDKASLEPVLQEGRMTQKESNRPLKAVLQFDEGVCSGFRGVAEFNRR
jgi:hypothetical protein